MNNNHEKQELQEERDPKFRKLPGKAYKASSPRTQIRRPSNINVTITRKKPTSLKVSIPSKPSCGQNENIDKYSCMGRFGWTSIGNEHIPYLIRLGENYCSVRMLESKVLNTWIKCFCEELYNCTNVESYYISEIEASLLNEIAFYHCESQFGEQKFQTGDLVVRLADATEFYQFLRHCHNKIAAKTERSTTDRCGFVRINNESVLPFIVNNGQRYVPLFYFEGEMDNVKLHVETVEGWNLSYLKFCFKVQGIRNELFDHDFCQVLSLNYIKSSFPPGTVIEDYWPIEIPSQLLMSEKLPLPRSVQWFKRPSVPPPNPKPATQANASPTLSSKTIATYFGVAGGQSANNITADSSVSSTSTLMMNGASKANYRILVAAAPPKLPLTRVGTAVRVSQPPTLYYNGPNMTEQNQNNNSATTELFIVPGQKRNTGPYKMQTAIVEGKVFRVINYKPYDSTVYLVALQDLVNNLFIGASAQEIQNVLKVLGIQVYKANAAQRRLLMKQRKCGNVREALPLVDLKNMLEYMNPIKFRLNQKEQIGEERQEPEKLFSAN